MVSKFEIGNLYNVVGIGRWSTLVKDLKVVAITDMSMVDILDLKLYDSWFEEYGATEAEYRKFLKENQYVYICQELVSRDITEDLISNLGDTIYIFPGMIDYSKSTRLLVCNQYSYAVITKPYLPEDKLNPITRNVDVRKIINNVITPHIYDSISVSTNILKVIVSEGEYNKISDYRLERKRIEENNTKTKDTKLVDDRVNLYSSLATLDIEQEKLRLKIIEYNKLIQQTSTLFNVNNSMNSQLITKEAWLRNIHAQLVEYNSNLPAGDQVNIPPFDDM